MTTQTKKLITIAKAGGKVVRGYFGQSLETMQKSATADFRTKADLESESVMLKMFAKDFPSYNIHSEEQGKTWKGSDCTLVVDPLDGTNNFVLGIPNFTVSIGLMKNDEIVTGIVYAPFLDHLYYAEKGGGSFLNDRRLHVNSESSISNSSISIVCGYTNAAGFESRVHKQLDDQKTKRVLTNWSPAYDFCMLASGKIEAVLFNNPEIYDFAAGKLLATEAGALITGFDGQPIMDKDGIFIASNGSALHQKILGVVNA